MDKKQNLVKQSFKEISNKVDKAYHNFILENVNDHCLRIAVMQDEQRWHYHKNTDELFVVLEGELKIEIKDNDTVFLKQGEFIKIPTNTIHKTSAVSRTVNLCFEKNADDTIFVDQTLFNKNLRLKIKTQSKMIYSIRYSLGENYNKSKSIYEQDLLEHGRYMKKLLDEGKLLFAGPFTDNTGGQVILKADNENEVKEIMNQDPAIIKNIFSYKMNTWDIKFNVYKN